MITRRIAPAATLLTSVGLLAACSAATESEPTGNAASQAAAPSRIVATTTLLGDVTSQIVACADPQATVTTLMPLGADPHDFSPSSAQVAELVGADLVVANGLGLEAGLTDALENAAADGATVLEVADLVEPIPFGAGSHSEDEPAKDEHAEDEPAADQHAEDEHDHGSEDPHFWFDMGRMASAAELIGEALATDGGPAYADCGVQVADGIRAAEANVTEILATVPAERRVLITDHDALGYFGEAYDFRIAGTVIPGGSTLGEPSSADLADLVAVINAESIPAIFTNTAEASTLSDAVAAETGRDIAVVPLYVGTLGEPSSGAEDYIGFMTTNAQRIADALSS